jgi:hypothetical protein
MPQLGRSPPALRQAPRSRSICQRVSSHTSFFPRPLLRAPPEPFERHRRYMRRDSGRGTSVVGERSMMRPRLRRHAAGGAKTDRIDGEALVLALSRRSAPRPASRSSDCHRCDEPFRSPRHTTTFPGDEKRRRIGTLSEPFSIFAEHGPEMRTSFGDVPLTNHFEAEFEV